MKTFLSSFAQVLVVKHSNSTEPKMEQVMQIQYYKMIKIFTQSGAQRWKTDLIFFWIFIVN